MTSIRTYLLSFGLLLSGFLAQATASSARPDEGMYPLSELKKLDLKALGLRLSADELFKPGGNSLLNALVQISGCTGSFVSPDGLIITNHHCAFSAVAAASSVANDYIKNGFLARKREEEIIAKGLTVKITLTYEDVSARVLNEQLRKTSDPAARLAMIRQNMKQVEREENKKNPGLECEVSEMFPGKVYVVFRYQTIQDIRLVYVPQRTIGEFGGESDNWVWPRHTGDFSFVRAYVSKDGKSAPYSADNVPFKPSRFLKINTGGVKENDAAFILGYPGRTFRHYPASFLRYQNEQFMPLTVELYDWAIANMKALGAENKALDIAYASRIKSLANVTKNYKGKLQGMKRIGLIQRKEEEEAVLTQWLATQPQTDPGWKTALPELNQVYNDMSATAARDFWLSQFPTFSPAFSRAVNFRAILKSLPDDKNLRTKIADSLSQVYAKSIGTDNYSMDWEKRAFELFCNKILSLPTEWIPASLQAAKTDLSKWQAKLYKQSKFFNAITFKNWLMEEKGDAFNLKKDLLFSLADEYLAINERLNAERNRRNGRITSLMPALLDAKMAFKPTTFLPDANSTLRFTHGRIRAYQPADGQTHLPFTHLSGMLEKEDGSEDFEVLPELKTLFNNRDFGSWAVKEGKDVPLAFLYNMDTTGGNSGSPVMNADGDLIGLNYDRAFTATINDYAWNESYSRSIGCDIRFILWTIEKVAKAPHLLQELGVK